MALHPLLSGREARRAQQFGPSARRKGAGWTRRFRKGRKQRLNPTSTPQVDTPVENEEAT